MQSNCHQLAEGFVGHPALQAMQGHRVGSCIAWVGSWATPTLARPHRWLHCLQCKQCTVGGFAPHPQPARGVPSDGWPSNPRPSRGKGPLQTNTCKTKPKPSKGLWGPNPTANKRPVPMWVTNSLVSLFL